MRVFCNNSVIKTTSYFIFKQTYVHNHLWLRNYSFQILRYKPLFCSNTYYGLHQSHTFYSKNPSQCNSEKKKSESKENVPLLSRGIFKFFFGRIRDKYEAEKISLALYKNMDLVEFQEFYSFFDMPDTFYSWFRVIELHVWMLLTQLMDNERKNLILRNTMIQLMWLDVEKRIENLGSSNNKILRKQLKELNETFPITLWVYDDGIFGNDIVLSSALWYKFFNKNCDDPRKIEVLVRYVRHQLHYLGVLNLKDLESVKKIKRMWVPLASHIKAVKEID